MIDGVQRSIFIYSLVQQLGEAPTLPMSVLHAKVSAQVTEQLRGQSVSQAPQSIGAIDQPLLMAPASDDPASLAVVDFSQRGCYADLTLDELRQLKGRYGAAGGAPFPALAYSMGEGFLDKEAFLPALSCFETAEAQSPVPFPLARLGARSLCCAFNATMRHAPAWRATARRSRTRRASR